MVLLLADTHNNIIFDLAGVVIAAFVSLKSLQSDPTKENVFFEVWFRDEIEEMILALVGQFKQLSHMYPENFQVTSTRFKPMASVTSAKVTLIIKFSLDISSTLRIIKLQSQCRSS